MKRQNDVLSSDEEPIKNKKRKVEESTPDLIDDTLVGEILGKEEVKTSNLEVWKSAGMFDYTSDEEVWLIQVPNKVSPKALKNLDFNSTESVMKCRVNGKRKKMNVSTAEEFPPQFVLSVPNRSNQLISLKTVPVTGQLILQENVKIKSDDNENCTVNNSVDFNATKVKSEKEDSN